MPSVALLQSCFALVMLIDLIVNVVCVPNYCFAIIIF